MIEVINGAEFPDCQKIFRQLRKARKHFRPDLLKIQFVFRLEGCLARELFSCPNGAGQWRETGLLIFVIHVHSLHYLRYTVLVIGMSRHRLHPI